jgi:histidyl-tRNA synthetase
VRVDVEQAGRSLKGQLKQADRVGARATVIVGGEVEVKDMETGEQTPASDADEAVALVERTLGS